jgi:hypothetical protein
MSRVHPGTSAILRYFEFSHLPMKLQMVSVMFHDVAHDLVNLGLDGPELTVALRKLLESKDAAVRAALDLEDR